MNFMANVAEEKEGADDVRRISRLYGGKEVQNDYRWEISLLYVGDYRYCERIQRHHKNNHI